MIKEYEKRGGGYSQCESLKYAIQCIKKVEADTRPEVEKEELDVDVLYVFLRSIDGCNTEWIDNDYADGVDLKKLAQAICSKFAPKKVGVEEIATIISEAGFLRGFDEENDRFDIAESIHQSLYEGTGKEE